MTEPWAFFLKTVASPYNINKKKKKNNDKKKNSTMSTDMRLAPHPKLFGFWLALCDEQRFSKSRYRNL